MKPDPVEALSVMKSYEQLSERLTHLPAGAPLDPYDVAFEGIVRENGPEKGAYMIGTLLTARQHAEFALATFPTAVGELPLFDRPRALSYHSLLKRMVRNWAAEDAPRM